ncbi:MAG: carbon-nitrogen hydrolase family protein [Amylibacter sp.]
MSRPVTVANLQTRPMPDFETALSEAISLAERAVADGAKLLCLPEYCGGLKTDGAAFAPPHAPEAEHPVLEGLRNFASANNVDMLVGSIAVTGQGAKFNNRGFYVDKSGDILSRYDKIFLFDVNLSQTEVYRESDRVEPGNQAIVADTRFGRIGHSICYDLRFAQLYRDLAQGGAEMMFCPAAFAVPTGQAHWHVLNRARAIENGAFMISPCAVGAVSGGGASYGHSVIVDPWGEILSDGGDATGVTMAQFDLDLVAQTRARIASLQHDRPYSTVQNEPITTAAE